MLKIHTIECSLQRIQSLYSCMRWSHVSTIDTWTDTAFVLFLNFPFMTERCESNETVLNTPSFCFTHHSFVRTCMRARLFHCIPRYTITLAICTIGCSFNYGTITMRRTCCRVSITDTRTQYTINIGFVLTTRMQTFSDCDAIIRA